MRPYYLGVLGLLCACGAMVALLPAATSAAYVGLAGCALSVVNMASPLSTIGTVLRERSSASSFLSIVTARAFYTDTQPRLYE